METLRPTVGVGLGAARGLGATEEMNATDAPDEDVWLRVYGPCGALLAERRLRPGDEAILGAGEGAEIRVDEPTVSRVHARVRAYRGGLRLEEIAARNGIEVGGVRVSAAWLGPAQRARLGRAVLEVGAAPLDVGTLGAPLPRVVGVSPPMLRLAARVRRIAPLPLPVLVRGPSGAGKDLVARALHDLSGRRGAYVALNAAAIARELAESELFGHVRGAFTGATAERRGAFREANQGTLFIDEIAALPLDLQAKLLRAVEEGLIRPLGAETSREVDVRLVVATCEPLEQRVEDGHFRADLYERIAACVVRVPGLDERPEDVPALARHLLDGMGMANLVVCPRTLRALASRSYRGHVRELRNLLAQAALHVADGRRIEPQHLAAALAERAAPTRPTPLDALRIFERSGSNASLAARRAGVPRSTLRDLVARSLVAGGDGVRPKGDARADQNVPTAPTPETGPTSGATSKRGRS